MTPQALAHPTLQGLPLVNLHTHLEGSVRPRTFLELCDRQGIPRPPTLEMAQRLLSVDGTETSLVDYLARIAPVGPALRNREALERVAFEAAEDAWGDGVAYFEPRAGPLLHVTDGLAAGEVIAAILHGLQTAEKQLGITARFIASALRQHDPAANEHLARLAGTWAGKGVVGFDLAGPEAGYPARAHARAFAIARAAGLGLSCHAGEASGSDSIVEAVQHLGARRIGHGTHLDDTPGRVEWAVAEGIVLEMCPTSNVDTRAVPSLAAHPIRRFFDAGVKITVGDDDPTTSRTHVARELALLVEHFGFTRDEILAIQRTGVDAAFAEPNALDPLLRRLNELKDT